MTPPAQRVNTAGLTPLEAAARQLLEHLRESEGHERDMRDAGDTLHAEFWKGHVQGLGLALTLLGDAAREERPDAPVGRGQPPKPPAPRSGPSGTIVEKILRVLPNDGTPMSGADIKAALPKENPHSVAAELSWVVYFGYAERPSRAHYRLTTRGREKRDGGSDGRRG